MFRMAHVPPDQDLMNYTAMTRNAMRGVVRAAIERAAMPGGLPGNHHFYISFRTRDRGVHAPPELLAKFPEEMTIVLQHQYWDLEVSEAQFSVTLKFGGQPRTLTVPFSALTQFIDPSVQFHLSFQPPEDEESDTELADTDGENELPKEPSSGPAPDPDKPNVVSLDQFRKK
jgi:hypothetical protein